MIEVIWEFEVPPNCIEDFEIHYGPDGTWTQLFERDKTYVGTLLLKDRKHTLRYLTVDRWLNENAYAAFKKEYATEYETIDARMGKLSSSERLIGIFEIRGMEE